MHALALVAAPDFVCCRYRVRAFLPLIESKVLAVEVRTLPQSWLQRLQFLLALPSVPVILWQRRLLSALDLAIVRRKTRRLVFDFDDAVFHPWASARRTFVRHRHARFRGLVRHCDAVIAGNQWLAEAARRHTDPAKVHVIPTCIDPTRYPVTALSRDTRDAADGVQLVWIGSSSTLGMVSTSRPLFEAIKRAVPGAQLKVIADAFPVLGHMPVVPVLWSEASEASALAAADVGVSWLPDNPWSRGKCGLKVLQYMVAGLPVIASPVGVQAEMVEHARSGFLVRSESEWIEAVRTLAADPALRQRFGQHGRELVEERFSVQTWAAEFARILCG